MEATYVVLINLFVVVKPGHPVLVDLDLLGFPLSVEAPISQREQVLLGLGHVSVRGQFHSGIALVVLTLGFGWIKAKGLLVADSGATSSRARRRTCGRLRRTSSRAGGTSRPSRGRRSTSVRHGD